MGERKNEGGETEQSVTRKLDSATRARGTGGPPEGASLRNLFFPAR